MTTPPANPLEPAPGSAEAAAPPPLAPATPEPDQPSTVVRLSSPQLVQELRGDLPCVKCRYNLKGVTVRGNCPECGTPVRVTILARVDPYAPVLQPIALPVLTAFAMLFWAIGPVVASAAVLLMRTRDLATEVAGIARPTDHLPVLGTIALGVSALGALALIRPHGGIKRSNILAALAGVAATVIAALFFWRLHAAFDPAHLKPYVQSTIVSAERAWLRLAILMCLAIAIVGLRPNARLLASRSLLMRMGRVDRQTMLAMLGAIAVAAAGDAMHLIATTQRPASASLITAGTVFIALGSFLLVVGFVGILIDVARVFPAIARKPLTYSQLVTSQDSRP